MRLLPICAIVLLPSLAHAETLMAKTDNTIGCQDPSMIQEIKRQMGTGRPTLDWETRIAQIGCYPVRSDIKWKVVQRIGDVVQVQLAMPGAPSPSLFFSAGDLRPAN